MPNPKTIPPGHHARTDVDGGATGRVETGEPNACTCAAITDARRDELLAIARRLDAKDYAAADLITESDVRAMAIAIARIDNDDAERVIRKGAIFTCLVWQGALIRERAQRDGTSLAPTTTIATTTTKIATTTTKIATTNTTHDLESEARHRMIERNRTRHTLPTETDE